MYHPNLTGTTAELDAAAEALGRASSVCRELGLYGLSTQLRSLMQEVNQHLLRREADHRQYVARQLSLVPPSAYDEPGTT
jgi:hypothetical protein